MTSETYWIGISIAAGVFVSSVLQWLHKALTKKDKGKHV